MVIFKWTFNVWKFLGSAPQLMFVLLKSILINLIPLWKRIISAKICISKWAVVYLVQWKCKCVSSIAFCISIPKRSRKNNAFRIVATKDKWAILLGRPVAKVTSRNEVKVRDPRCIFSLKYGTPGGKSATYRRLTLFNHMVLMLTTSQGTWGV